MEKSSTRATRSIVNNYNSCLYLNLTKWDGSIMANALDCRPRYLGSIPSRSTGGEV